MAISLGILEHQAARWNTNNVCHTASVHILGRVYR